MHGKIEITLVVVAGNGSIARDAERRKIYASPHFGIGKEIAFNRVEIAGVSVERDVAAKTLGVIDIGGIALCCEVRHTRHIEEALGEIHPLHGAACSKREIKGARVALRQHRGEGGIEEPCIG